MVSPLVYGPAGAVAGIARLRLAPSVLVPYPLPRPCGADASTAAVVPRPGPPGTGATVGPRTTAGASSVSVGVHPSWLPEKVPPTAVPLPVHAESWPETDQPG